MKSKVLVISRRLFVSQTFLQLTAVRLTLYKAGGIMRLLQYMRFTCSGNGQV